jgi:hemoglobin-like flavoprotein
MYLVETYFGKNGREMRGCQPRDLVEAIAAAARYADKDRKLTQATIDDACANYFV